MRDHGGGVDAAAAQFGGERGDWIDLSTGINPAPYPLPRFDPDCWTALPDRAAYTQLVNAARAFWQIPESASIIAAPGASALIARLPAIHPPGRVQINGPTYNEHAASYSDHGWTIVTDRADVRVVVHPNNPDGRLWQTPDADDDWALTMTVIDESFCDVMPEASLIDHTARRGTIVLKSFGKFWGLAGLRLGFAIGDPDLIAQLDRRLGPWAVSGPAIATATQALRDADWAEATRARLTRDAARLDAAMIACGASVVGGTTLFRLYDTANAERWQRHLASHRIWSRRFPYSERWLRLGLPASTQWDRIETALATIA
ncbi:MAG: threonine-phosphate decarboxylase CobD [Gemmobacter sp.]|nr:threonine-phosphate decarboxylase CobD [Gemmobacter sp.]